MSELSQASKPGVMETEYVKQIEIERATHQLQKYKNSDILKDLAFLRAQRRCHDVNIKNRNHELNTMHGG